MLTQDKTPDPYSDPFGLRKEGRVPGQSKGVEPEAFQ